MNASTMKNMIILKDLPSNIIEEAYIVVKPNIKLKTKINNNNNNNELEESSNYIVQEAESVISNYVSNLESFKKINNLEMNKIKNKYKKMKKICIGLIIVTFISIISIIGQIRF